MGVFDFIGDIANTVKNGVGSAFDAVKNVGGSIWDKAKGVGGSIWSKVSGIAGKAEHTAEVVADKVADKIDRLSDAGIQGVSNVGNLLGNPVVVIGGLIVAGIVLTKVL